MPLVRVDCFNGKRQGLAIQGHVGHPRRQHIGQKGMSAFRHGCGCLRTQDEFHAPCRPGVSRRERAQGFEVRAVRGGAIRLEPLPEHLLQHGNDPGGAIVPKEIVRVSGVFWLRIPLQVLGHCANVFRRKVEHLLLERAALEEVEVLESAVALYTQTVVHPAFHEPNIEPFIHHECAVVEDVIEPCRRVKHPNRRVAKGGVQIRSGAGCEHRHTGVFRQLVREVSRRGRRMPKGKQRQCQRVRPLEHPLGGTVQPHFAERAIAVHGRGDLQHASSCLHVPLVHA